MTEGFAGTGASPKTLKMNEKENPKISDPRPRCASMRRGLPLLHRDNNHPFRFLPMASPSGPPRQQRPPKVPQRLLEFHRKKEGGILGGRSTEAQETGRETRKSQSEDHKHLQGRLTAHWVGVGSRCRLFRVAIHTSADLHDENPERGGLSFSPASNCLSARGGFSAHRFDRRPPTTRKPFTAELLQAARGKSKNTSVQSCCSGKRSPPQLFSLLPSNYRKSCTEHLVQQRKLKKCVFSLITAR